MIKALIFDVDGTVVRSKNAFGESLWSLDIEENLGVPLECRWEIFTQDWQRVMCGELNTLEYLQRVFKKYPQLSITPKKFVEYWLSHDAHVDAKGD
jgi:beta-phosphoglucomutase-like phosphatase (HAD superfamily)